MEEPLDFYLVSNIQGHIPFFCIRRKLDVPASSVFEHCAEWHEMGAPLDTLVADYVRYV